MSRRDNNHGLPSLRNEVETLFGEVLRLGRVRGGPGARWLPSLDLIEGPEGYVVEMDMPGVRLQDVTVSVSGRRLTLSGRREGARELAGAHVRVHERWSGTFSRSLELPGAVQEDRVAVALRDGILRIELPRRGTRP